MDGVDSVRALAAGSVSEAIAEAERLRASSDDPAMLYLLAELRARSGQALAALDLIDDAQRGFRDLGMDWEAERCEIGRVAVLDDLGRHDDAIEIANHQIERLHAAAPGDPDQLELLLRAHANRGLCLESTGRYVEALADHDAAAELARRVDTLSEAHVLINRAVVLSLLGQSGDAIADLDTAWSALVDVGDREDRVKVATNLGSAHARRGQFDDALRWLGRAETEVEIGTDDHCVIQVEIGEALDALGDYEGAASRFRRALELLADTPISWLEGRAWMGLGGSSFRLGDGAVGRHAFRSAIESFDAAGNVPQRAWAMLELAGVEARDGGLRSLALDEAQRAVELTDVERWPVQTVVALIRVAELSEPDGRERLLRRAHRIATRLDLAPLRFEVERRLGELLVGLGRFDDARRHVERAALMAESLRSELHHPGLLRTLPRALGSAFDDLVALRAHDGDLPGAFVAADRARSRSILDVVGGRVRVAGASEVTEVERELHAVYDQLLGAAASLPSEARTLLEQRARLLERQVEDSERAFHDRGGTGTGMWEAPDPASVGCALVYLVRDGLISLFFVERGEVEYHPAIASTADVERCLAELHSSGRRAVALHAAGVPAPSTALAAVGALCDRLGDLLLAPVSERMLSRSPSGGPVTIVPSGLLYAVPFAAVSVAGGSALIDYRSIVLAPSLGLEAAARRSAAASDRVVLVGTSSLGLEHVVREIAEIQEAWPDATVLVDAAARRDTVLAAMSGVAVAHVATHGMFRSRSPLSSGLRLADGWLSSRDVAGIDLRGAVVVLSACDTGRTEAAPGDEVLGALYGFLAAGARNVVTSLWAAHDETCAGLMAELHRRMAAGAPPADSLRAAQLMVRSERPHPFWWAPYAVYGSAR